MPVYCTDSVSSAGAVFYHSPFGTASMSTTPSAPSAAYSHELTWNNNLQQLSYLLTVSIWLSVASKQVSEQLTRAAHKTRNSKHAPKTKTFFLKYFYANQDTWIVLCVAPIKQNECIIYPRVNADPGKAVQD